MWCRCVCGEWLLCVGDATVGVRADDGEDDSEPDGDDARECNGDVDRERELEREYEREYERECERGRCCFWLLVSADVLCL